MMMDDLISRKDAIDIMNAKGDVAQGTPKAVFYSAAHMLEMLPAVDAKPVRHGTWEMCRATIKKDFVTFTGTYPTCSLCGHVEYGVDKSTPYCPGCGAKMDGDEKNV